jgi:ADP-heptose:LPS heptosyltransferase
MRVLIVRCGALGDLVYSTSVIDALRLEYGKDIKIDVVTTPASAKLFDFDDRINKVFLLKHKKVHIIFSSQKKAVIKESKKEPYDLLINFEMGKQFRSLVEKIKAKRKAGWFCENITITKTHMVEICKEFYSSVVSSENIDKAYPRLLGEDFGNIKLKFHLPDDYIVFSPSNSHNKKKGINYRAWPHSHWKELLNMMPKNMHIVMIGAKGEEAFFEPIKPYGENVIDLVGKISIPQMVSVVANAKALVVTDTGTAHIASAVNTPVFCLIGPTPAEQTGPYKTPYNKVFILKSDMECSPCYKTRVMEECNDNLCMKNILPVNVFDRLKSANIV